MQTTQRHNKLWVAVASKTSMQHCMLKGKRFITCCLSVFKTALAVLKFTKLVDQAVPKLRDSLPP